MIDRVAVFGDAAGLCKPTTGGGIGKGFDQVDLMLPKLVVYNNQPMILPHLLYKTLNDTISTLEAETKQI